MSVGNNVGSNGCLLVVPVPEDPGRLVENGYGGSVNVRVVVPPSPSGTRTGIGGTLMLGRKTRSVFFWPCVTLTLEYIMLFVVISGTSTVIVTVLVMNAVVSLPPIVVFPSAPYSRDVVNFPGLIVVASESLLGGNTKVQGASQAADGVSYTLGSRKTGRPDV